MHGEYADTRGHALQVVEHVVEQRGLDMLKHVDASDEATWLRRRFTEELGPEYATLLDVLSEAREELRATGRSSEDPDWQSALDSGMLELIRAGRVDEAKEILRACLWS